MYVCFFSVSIGISYGCFSMSSIQSVWHLRQLFSCLFFPLQREQCTRLTHYDRIDDNESLFDLSAPWNVYEWFTPNNLWSGDTIIIITWLCVWVFLLNLLMWNIHIHIDTQPLQYQPKHLMNSSNVTFVWLAPSIFLRYLVYHFIVLLVLFSFKLIFFRKYIVCNASISFEYKRS